MCCICDGRRVMSGSARTVLAAISLLPFCLTISSAQASTTPTNHAAISAEAHALDGDTIAVDMRLEGVDAFERNQLCEDRQGQCSACGQAARALLKRLLSQSGNGRGNRSIEIRFVQSTTYGRPVIRARANGRDIGLSLIAAGLAVPEPKYLSYDPARRSAYAAAFSKARAAKHGAFGGRWITPSSWRQGQRLECET